MRSLNNFDTSLKSSRKIAILSHINPDADAYGSALALKKAIFLISPDAEVDVFVDNNGEVAELYQPLVKNAQLNPEITDIYDLAISLDSPSPARLGKYAHIFQQAKSTVNIDHHESNTLFADNNFLSLKSSSTCELLYYMLKSLKIQFDKEIATFLYCGILTDTCCLTQGVITAITYKCLEELTHYDVAYDSLRAHFFANNSKAKSKLSAIATINTLFAIDDRIGIMTIKNSDLQKSGATFEDTLGIITNVSSIKSVDFAAIIIEKEPGHFYVSMRSRGEVDVIKIAQKFNGGGNNINMAAFQFEGELGSLKSDLLNLAKEEVEIHPSSSSEMIEEAFNFE